MRNKKEIKERILYIRKHTPNILEDCFEMQNRLCDLCGQPIQSLILAELDHSLPIKHFAFGPLDIEEAEQLCNDPKNLRAAHTRCNSVKRDKTREEWFALGLDKKVDEIKILSTEELENLKKRMSDKGRPGAYAAFTREMQSENGKKMGPINGRKCVEEKKGIFSPDFDRSAAGKIGGPIGGRIAGQIAKESGRLSEMGKIGGRISKERGRLSEMGKKGGKIRGPIIGRWAVESGQLARVRQRSNHNRWHVWRGIKNPKCIFCLELE